MRNILVTGSHRSGTTWTGNMISLSKEVHYINEIFNPWRDPGRCQIDFDKWFTYLPLGTTEPYLSALQETIIEHRYHLLRGLMSVKTLGELKARFLEFSRNLVAAQKPDLRSLLKDPIALFSAEWLADSFNMDVVVMIRHPAYFVSSLLKNQYNFPFEDLLSQDNLMEDYLADFSTEIQQAPTNPLDQAILLWRIFYHVVWIYQGKFPSWLYVRYEDLATDPLNGFKRIYRELNLDWNPELAREISSFSSPDNPVETRESMDIRRNSREMIQQWKNRLTKYTIQKIKEETADVWPGYYQESDW